MLGDMLWCVGVDAVWLVDVNFVWCVDLFARWLVRGSAVGMLKFCTSGDVGRSASRLVGYVLLCSGRAMFFDSSIR